MNTYMGISIVPGSILMLMLSSSTPPKSANLPFREAATMRSTRAEAVKGSLKEKKEEQHLGDLKSSINIGYIQLQYYY